MQFQGIFVPYAKSLREIQKSAEVWEVATLDVRTFVNNLRSQHRDDLSFPICISGFVEMNTGNIRVKPHSNGIVASVLFQEGQRVKKSAAQQALLAGQLAQAKAEVAQAKIALDQKMARAPVDGLILKVGIRPGERVSNGYSVHAVLMGDDRPLYIRMQIDENDIQRFKSDLKVYAFLKSAQNVKFPLKFIRMAPYAPPKPPER